MDPTHENSLARQVAVVTGASRGIGAAIALRLAKMGAAVVITGRSRPALESMREKILQAGGQSSAFECDVRDLNSVERVATNVNDTFGRLDILVNNAGVGGPGGPLHQFPPQAWDEVMNTNLRGVFYMIRAFAPMMIRSGGKHIVNISSLAGKNALPNGATYAASKWGLNGLSYSVAEELRAHNIRVSVVCPGSVLTDFSLHPGKKAEKMLKPEDVAHVIAMIVTQAPQSFASEVLLRPTQKP